MGTDADDRGRPGTERAGDGQTLEARSSHPIGADGYGLNDAQQKAAADLWAWQRESMTTKTVLGGPLAD